MSAATHGTKVEEWRRRTDTSLTVIALGSLPIMFLHFRSIERWRHSIYFCRGPHSFSGIFGRLLD